MKITNAGRDPAALMADAVEPLKPNSWAELIDYSSDTMRMSGNDAVAGFKL